MDIFMKQYYMCILTITTLFEMPHKMCGTHDLG